MGYIKCRRCGIKIPVVKRGKQSKYCEDCKVIRKNTYAKFYYNNPHYMELLGTSNFHNRICRKPDGSPDFIRERQEINAEFVILGLAKTKLQKKKR